MIATMIKGIVLILFRLLALTVDQMAKIKEAIERYGSVEAHYLSEIRPPSLRQTIIPCMEEIEYRTSSTMFLFSSPQYLATNGIVIDDILRCRARQTFRLLAIDKAHLYAMHGRSFRDAMRILQRLLFVVLFKVGE